MIEIFKVGWIYEITDRATAKAKDIRKNLNKITDSSGRASDTVSQLGEAIGGLAVITAGLKGLNILGSGVSIAAGLEESLVKLRAITRDIGGNATIDLGKLEAKLDSISTSIPTSTAELAKLSVEAAKLGIRGVDNLSAVSKSVVELGVAADIEAGAALIQLAKITNALGEKLDASNVNNYASAIAFAAANFSTTSQEILEATKRFAASAKTFKIAESRVIGFQASLLNVGLTAELAGRQSDIAMQRLATSIGSAAQLVVKAGLSGSVAEFKQLFEEDASKALLVFSKAIKVAAKGSSILTTELLRGFGIRGTNTQKIIKVLGNNFDKVTKDMNDITQAFKEGTFVTKVFAERSKTFNKVWQTMSGIVENILKTFGNFLLPILTTLTFVLGKLLAVFLAMPAPIKFFVFALIGIGSAAVIAKGAIILLTSSIVRGLLPALKATFLLLAPITLKIAAIATVLFAIWKAFVLLLDVVVVALVFVWKVLVFIVDTVKQLWGLFARSRNLSKVSTGLKLLAIALFVIFFKAIVIITIVVQLVKGIIFLFKAFIGLIVSLGKAFTKWITKTDAFKSIIKWWKLVVDGWGAGMQLMGFIWGSFINNLDTSIIFLTALLSDPIRVMGETWAGIVQGMGEIWAIVSKVIEDNWDGVIQGLVGSMTAAIGKISQLWSKFSTKLRGMVSWIPGLGPVVVPVESTTSPGGLGASGSSTPASLFSPQIKGAADSAINNAQSNTGSSQQETVVPMSVNIDGDEIMRAIGRTGIGSFRGNLIR